MPNTLARGTELLGTNTPGLWEGCGDADRPGDGDGDGVADCNTMHVWPSGGVEVLNAHALPSGHVRFCRGTQSSHRRIRSCTHSKSRGNNQRSPPLEMQRKGPQLGWRSVCMQVGGRTVGCVGAWVRHTRLRGNGTQGTPTYTGCELPQVRQEVRVVPQGQPTHDPRSGGDGLRRTLGQGTPRLDKRKVVEAVLRNRAPQAARPGRPQDGRVTGPQDH
jgi:hypothetical protein